MDRIIQSGLPRINLCAGGRGSSKEVYCQTRFQSSSLSQCYFSQKDDRNRRGISHYFPLCRETKLFSCRIWSLGYSQGNNGSQFLQLQAKSLTENNKGCVEVLDNVGLLSKKMSSEYSMNKDCIIKSSSSLLDEGIQKQKRKLITTIGAIILLSALTVISTRPAFATAGIIGTNVAAKGGSSGAVAVGEKAARSLLRSELLSSAWTGLVAGCLHTLTGPDHLAALAPLSIGRTKLESAAVGAVWGCGHDAGQVIFGILFLILKDKLQIELLRSWGARVVGITLLAIGVMGIKEASEVAEPCVALESGNHQISILESTPSLKSGKKSFGYATFATGIVHGLQPDALLMVLPALALPSRVAGAAFLFMFLLGTIMAMGSYTAFIGSCSDALKTRVPRITEGLSWGSSLVAIALGGAVLLSEFIGIALF